MKKLLFTLSLIVMVGLTMTPTKIYSSNKKAIIAVPLAPSTTTCNSSSAWEPHGDAMICLVETTRCQTVNHLDGYYSVSISKWNTGMCVAVGRI